MSNVDQTAFVGYSLLRILADLTHVKAWLEQAMVVSSGQQDPPLYVLHTLHTALGDRSKHLRELVERTVPIDDASLPDYASVGKPTNALENESDISALLSEGVGIALDSIDVVRLMLEPVAGDSEKNILEKLALDYQSYFAAGTTPIPPQRIS